MLLLRSRRPAVRCNEQQASPAAAPRPLQQSSSPCPHGLAVSLWRLQGRELVLWQGRQRVSARVSLQCRSWCLPHIGLPLVNKTKAALELAKNRA